MQSNAEAIASARKRQRELSNVPRATELLVKSGVSLADLDALPIVHVSGTKVGIYRVTHQVVFQVVLTSKQKLRFSMRSKY